MERLLTIALFLCAVACAEQPPLPEQLLHYDLRNPEKYELPDVLHEISGIAFPRNTSDPIYAEQDERGTLFHFHPGGKDIAETKFAKKGDYEDVTILCNTVFMLRSDGTLFSFPLEETTTASADHVQEWKDLVPAGEYESVFGDENDGRLYMLCKNCPGDKAEKEVSGYILQLAEGNLQSAGNFKIDAKKIAGLNGQKKIRLRPSGMTKNYKTNEWFILSSVSSVLVVTDNNWNAKQVIPLDPKTFNQPEGIAFDAQNNLYISNEGGVSTPGNILKFNYRQ